MAEINGYLDLLPPDVLQNILLSLPFNTLARCRIISRSLNDFITSPRLVDSHLRRSKILSDLDPIFLGINTVSEYLPNLCSKITLRGRMFQTRQAIPMPGSLLLCYCDGMFLLQGNYYCDYHLWNPSLRKHTTFFGPYGAIKGVYGLCRGPMETGEFYIVIGNGYYYSVYSSKTKSWSISITNFPKNAYLTNSAGLSVGGAVYWDWVRSVEKRDVQYIVCFDSKDEMFKILEKPEDLKATDRIHLVCLNDQLCGWFNDVEKSRVRMWSFNGRGSWKEFMRIHAVPEGFGSIRPLYFVGDRILIHKEGFRFVFYSFSSKRFEEFWDTRSLTRRLSVAEIFPYLESLVFFGMP